MRTLAILPVKKFEDAKQRLAETLPGGTRAALVQAMFSDVLVALRHAERIDAIAVVTVDPMAQARVRAERVLLLEDTRQAGQSVATEIGVRHALDERFDRVLLVPGDAPLLDPIEVDALLDAAEADGLSAVIVPDRHGTGTNALAIAPPDALAPSFGPGSLERHIEAAEQSALAYRVEEVESLLYDVDTADDLATLRSILDGRRRLAPMTRGALFQLDRAHSAADEPPQPAGDAVEV